MDEEDEVGLTKINAQIKDSPHCTEDQFEEVMAFFEDTARNKQPFSAVDNPPVLTLQELEEQFDEHVEPSVKTWAKTIYPHWRDRRIAANNQSVQPTLKVWRCFSKSQPVLTLSQFETSPDADDADPYVCFRRREVRQIRKTRGRDAQSAEKLRKLRKELEDARILVAMVKQRELARKEVLTLERQLFKQRAEFKETKRKLGIKGDDEDLINQKVKRNSSTFMTDTDLYAAKEKDRAHSCSTSHCPSTTLSGSESWSKRRPQASRRRASRERESNRKRDSAERGKTHQVERRVCRQDESATYSRIRKGVRSSIRLSTSHANHGILTYTASITL